MIYNLNKKLTSALLSTLLLSQSVMYMPVNAYKKSEQQITENVKKNKASRNESSTFEDIVLAGALSCAVAVLPLSALWCCGYFSPETPKNINLNEFEYSIIDLYRNRKDMINQVLEFSDSNSRDKSISEALRCLKEAFHTLQQNKKLNNLAEIQSKLSKALQKNITKLTESDCIKLLERQKSNCTNFGEPQPRSSAWIPLVKHIDIKNTKYKNLAKLWQEKYHVPVKAMLWHDNLCWFHSSLLLFFHEAHYNELICKFPIEEAEKMLQSSGLSAHDRANLEAMIDLSYIFRILSVNPNISAECVDFKYTPLEKLLIRKLNIAFELEPKNYNYMTYGKYCTPITGQLYKLIRETSLIPGHSKSWHEFRERIFSAPVPTLDDYGFFNHPELRIVEAPGHFFVRLSVGEEKLSLGEDWSKIEGHIQKQQYMEDGRHNNYSPIIGTAEGIYDQLLEYRNELNIALQRNDDHIQIKHWLLKLLNKVTNLAIIAAAEAPQESKTQRVIAEAQHAAADATLKARKIEKSEESKTLTDEELEETLQIVKIAQQAADNAIQTWSKERRKQFVEELLKRVENYALDATEIAQDTMNSASRMANAQRMAAEAEQAAAKARQILPKAKQASAKTKTADNLETFKAFIKVFQKISNLNTVVNKKWKEVMKMASLEEGRAQ